MDKVEVIGNGTGHGPRGELNNVLSFNDPGMATLAAFVGLVNISLLLVMFGIYLSSYRRLKSRFTLRPAILHLTLTPSKRAFHALFDNRGRFPWAWNGVPCS